jgi:hypothetical protein
MLKKYSINSFIKMFVFVIVIEIVLHFFVGYYYWVWDSFIVILVIRLIRIVFTFLVFGRIIRSKITRSYKWKYGILCLLLTSISMIPKQHYSTLGKITYMYNNDITRISVEVRNLMDIYEPLTHFGIPQRAPLNNPQPLNEVPQNIKSFHKGEILILENVVLLEWGSLLPSFQGFVIFEEGFDPWVNENPIVLQDFWFASWKIRIADGFYWYKINGDDNPFIEEMLELYYEE